MIKPVLQARLLNTRVGLPETTVEVLGVKDIQSEYQESCSKKAENIVVEMN